MGLSTGSRVSQQEWCARRHQQSISRSAGSSAVRIIRCVCYDAPLRYCYRAHALVLYHSFVGIWMPAHGHLDNLKRQTGSIGTRHLQDFDWSLRVRELATFATRSPTVASHDPAVPMHLCFQLAMASDKLASLRDPRLVLSLQLADHTSTPSSSSSLSASSSSSSTAASIGSSTQVMELTKQDLDRLLAEFEAAQQVCVDVDCRTQAVV